MSGMQRDVEEEENGDTDGILFYCLSLSLQKPFVSRDHLYNNHMLMTSLAVECSPEIYGDNSNSTK